MANGISAKEMKLYGYTCEYICRKATINYFYLRDVYTYTNTCVDAHAFALVKTYRIILRFIENLNRHS